ncbi:hypothetical protein BA768_18445 [Chryseobacterium sp. CBo1]|nr:hypothetical protein BA768_18445 [Chryseobacterium sp. CBo1]
MIKNLLCLFFCLFAFTFYHSINKAENDEFFCNTLAPLNVTVTNISHTEATVSWANDPATPNYTVEFRPVGNFAWMSSTIPTNQDFYKLTGLMSCTAYEVRVAKICNNLPGTWSTIVVFNTLSPNGCASASTDTAIMHISNVTLTPAPGLGLSTMVSNSSNSNYTDYRPDPTRKINLVAGSLNNVVSVTKSGPVFPATANVTVWIDYNANGLFEYSERVLMGTNANPTYSLSFNVPATVPKCDVTMRVVYSNVTLADGCGSFGYGEVEDYGVHFTANNLSVDEVNDHKEISIYPNPTSDILIVSGISSEQNYTIYNAVGQSISKGKTNDKKTNVNYLIKGVYFIELNGKENKVRLKFIKK